MSLDYKEKAILLDTNFIVEQKDKIRKTLSKLSENHDVYITELSINERIGQKIVEAEKIYKKIEDAEREFKDYATIKITKNYNEKIKFIKQVTLKHYNDFFSEKIIPLLSEKEVLNEVLERVYIKKAPFNSTPGSSDKGFKDTLLWLSAIEYFKNYANYSEIVFITNDNGFLSNESELAKEFQAKTNIPIIFKKNDYYKSLTGEMEEVITKKTDLVIKISEQEKQNIRYSISNIFHDLCFYDEEDWNGNSYRMNNFSIADSVDISNVEAFLNNLSDFLNKHIFHENVKPSELFKCLNVQVEDLSEIPITVIDKLSELYKSIVIQYNEFLPQFLLIASEKINETYKKKSDGSDDLPF